MKYWLMKTEPEVFSFEDLIKAPRRTTHWEGVRNYQARNFMRDEFKLGDLVLIYHSNTEIPSIRGIAEVVREGYPDDSALNPRSEFFDESAKKKGVSPWVMVDVKATVRFSHPVSRPQMQGLHAFSKMMLLKKGSRLSIQPVTAAEFREINKLGKGQPLG
jgi:predicted RNA-binding protein with PUA-like domain